MNWNVFLYILLFILGAFTVVGVITYIGSLLEERYGFVTSLIVILLIITFTTATVAGFITK